MNEFETDVIEIIQRTPDVKSFRFKAEKAPNFKAGQFFFVTIKIDNEEKSKHFSFSNSPTEKGYVEFTKRITESPFSKALDKLNIDDWAKLRMPLGFFTFDGEYKKIAFLSGGIGITPIRSICKFITDKRMGTDIILLYGNNKEEDMVFRSDFEDMKKANKDLRVVHTLTSPDVDKTKWRGRTGYIDENMIREEVPDYKERVFYICGPPKMVEALVSILKSKLGLDNKRIKLENFTGY